MKRGKTEQEDQLSRRSDEWCYDNDVWPARVFHRSGLVWGLRSVYFYLFLLMSASTGFVLRVSKCKRRLFAKTCIMR